MALLDCIPSKTKLPEIGQWTMFTMIGGYSFFQSQVEKGKEDVPI